MTTLSLVALFLGACGVEPDAPPSDARVGANFTPFPDAYVHVDASIDAGWENPPGDPFAACLWLCDLEQRPACTAWSRGDCRNECYIAASQSGCPTQWIHYLNCKITYYTANANACVPPGVPAAEPACAAFRERYLDCWSY